MSWMILDESNLRQLPPDERLKKCAFIVKNEKDESKRWDAVWITGEIDGSVGPDDPLFDEAAEVLAWVLLHDNNGVVKHEVCFQIAARNMRKKIPDLIKAVLHDKSLIARHEALECLALMRAYDSMSAMSKAIDDPETDVSTTAVFALKRLKRLKNNSEYRPSEIL